jgi:hypothetical protein
VGNPDSLNGPAPSASEGLGDGSAGATLAGPAPPLALGEAADGTMLQQQQQPQQHGPPAKWICRATLRESPRAVRDVEFAPRHVGLRLAAAGADGVVRVYEAVDVMNLSHWPLQVREGRRGRVPMTTSPPPSDACLPVRPCDHKQILT